MNPPILNIQMVPAGVELVLQALGKLPYEQSAGLIAEIRGQAEYQLAPKLAPPVVPPKARGGRPKGSKNKAAPVEPAAPAQSEGGDAA